MTDGSAVNSGCKPADWGVAPSSTEGSKTYGGASRRGVERVDAYRHFFERYHDWLVLQGWLALQTIVKGNNVRVDHQAMLDQPFVAERIFPETTPHQAKMPICERLAGRAEMALVVADDLLGENVLGLVTTGTPYLRALLSHRPR